MVLLLIASSWRFKNRHISVLDVVRQSCVFYPVSSDLPGLEEQAATVLLVYQVYQQHQQSTRAPAAAEQRLELVKWLSKVAVVWTPNPCTTELPVQHTS